MFLASDMMSSFPRGTSTSIWKMVLLTHLFVTIVACSQQVIASYDNSTTSGDDDGKRIAVIGAGAGGSAFSYYLQRYTSHAFNITVFESNGYIGGRSTTIGNYVSSLGNVTDEYLLNCDIELGGSVFVEANAIMVNGAEMFDLSTADNGLSDTDKLTQTVGIWTGSKFNVWLDASSTITSLLGDLKLIIKYNFSIFRLFLDLQSYVNNFVGYFYHEAFPYDMQTVVADAGLSDTTGSYASKFLKTIKHWYADNFLYDIVGPATRVNYLSDLDDIHAFGAYISMAASNANAIKGGNFQIFERFLEESEAQILLNTKVTKISQNGDGKWTVSYGDGDSAKFDQVVIAAPLQLTGIVFEGADMSKLQNVEYRIVHATYIQTPIDHLMDKPQFGSKGVPQTMFTTANDSIPFKSTNIVHYDNSTNKVTYKVFTDEAIDKDFVAEQFFSNMTDVEILFAHEWKAYPILKPTTIFDKFEVHEGLWYLNSMERFISTMETAALAGAAVAGHIAQGFNTEPIVVP